MVRKPRPLTIDDFLCDAHAARYQGEFDTHPTATRHLLAVLNDPASADALEQAERHGRPALSGIVAQLEGDPAILDVLASGAAGHRFRQTVGVAVKLKMRTLGWATTGRKGTVRGAHHFTKAEHYEPPPAAKPDYKARALAGLRAVEGIGGDDERTRTGDELLHNLATTRASEHRPF
jgi:hypothetical protein